MASSRQNGEENQQRRPPVSLPPSALFTSASSPISLIVGQNPQSRRELDVRTGLYINDANNNSDAYQQAAVEDRNVRDDDDNDEDNDVGDDVNSDEENREQARNRRFAFHRFADHLMRL